MTNIIVNYYQHYSPRCAFASKVETNDSYMWLINFLLL